MKHPLRWYRLIIIAFVFIAAGCAGEGAEPAAGEVSAQRENVRSYEGIGVVKTITQSGNYVNIDHEAISGFMDAMAMFFPVADTSILGGIAAEDSVRFTLEAGMNGVALVKIEAIH